MTQRELRKRRVEVARAPTTRGTPRTDPFDSRRTRARRPATRGGWSRGQPTSPQRSRPDARPPDEPRHDSRPPLRREEEEDRRRSPRRRRFGPEAPRAGRRRRTHPEPRARASTPSASWSRRARRSTRLNTAASNDAASNAPRARDGNVPGGDAVQPGDANLPPRARASPPPRARPRAASPASRGAPLVRDRARGPRARVGRWIRAAAGTRTTVRDVFVEERAAEVEVEDVRVVDVEARERGFHGFDDWRRHSSGVGASRGDASSTTRAPTARTRSSRRWFPSANHRATRRSTWLEKDGGGPPPGDDAPRAADEDAPLSGRGRGSSRRGAPPRRCGRGPRARTRSRRGRRRARGTRRIPPRRSRPGAGGARARRGGGLVPPPLGGARARGREGPTPPTPETPGGRPRGRDARRRGRDPRRRGRDGPGADVDAIRGRERGAGGARATPRTNATAR